METESFDLWSFLDGVPCPDNEVKIAKDYIQKMKREFEKISKENLVGRNIRGGLSVKNCD